MVRALDDGVGIESAEQRLTVPPHSIEAEQSLLGGLMLDTEAWDKIADLVIAADFYRPDHRLIFSAITELVKIGSHCDAVTISEYLKSRNELEAGGGLGYLATLANETPGAANVTAYATIVREHSMLRSLISAGNAISGNAFNTDGRTATDLVDEAERLVFDIAEKGARGRAGFKSLKQILPDVVDRIDLLHQSGEEITGIPSGFNEFDKLTAGLQPGDLIVVAGRPSMGKTAFAVNIAENAAIGAKVPTAIFSMEMSSQQLAGRLLSSLGRVDQSHLRSGKFPDEDWSRINNRGSAHVRCANLHRRRAKPVADRDSCQGPAFEAREQSRSHCDRLSAIDAGPGQYGESSYRDFRDITLAKSTGERTRIANHYLVAAQSQRRTKN